MESRPRPKRRVAVALVVLLVASFASLVMNFALVLADQGRRADQLRLVEAANLAEQADDLAVSLLHLEPALREADESLGDLREDIDDESELVIDYARELGLPAQIEQQLVADAERAVAMAEQAQPATYAEIRPLARSLHQHAGRLYDGRTTTSQATPVQIRTDAVDLLWLTSERLAAGAPEQGDLPADTAALATAVESAIDASGSDDELAEVVSDLKESPAVDFALFDGLNEVIVGMDDLISGTAVDPVPNRGALVLVSAVIAVATCVGLLALQHRRRADRQIYEAGLRHKAGHDDLTGLLNRSQLASAFEAVRKGAGGKGAILLLDLDRFKQVNDRLGHYAGDQLLCTVADRLRDSLGADGVAVRLGGDEFVVFCGDVADQGEAIERAEQLVQVVSTPYELEGAMETVGVSIGVAFTNDASTPLEPLIRDADAALFVAKHQGRGQVVGSADPTVTVEPDARRRLTSRL